MSKQTHYFAEDGSYGDATGLLVTDSSKFTEADWEAIDMAPDDDRVSLAVAITSKYDPSVLSGLPKEDIDKLNELLVEYEVEVK